MIARCACGGVELTVVGAPITCAACYCDDCQEGARRIEALPNAMALRDPDGGTAYVLYRKDRVACARGAELLRDDKIRAASATSRVVATCCNTGMFVRVDGWGHWLSVYRARLLGAVPPLQMRVGTKFKPADSVIPADVPSYPTFPLRFVARLVAAKVAMLLSRAPRDRGAAGV